MRIILLLLLRWIVAEVVASPVLPVVGGGDLTGHREAALLPWMTLLAVLLVVVILVGLVVRGEDGRRGEAGHPREQG